jgi:hypothetical protein
MKNTLRPIVFIDMDDVLVVSREYTSYQVITTFKLNAVSDWPELWAGLILPEARANLAILHVEFTPQYVVSSSWASHLGREQMCEVFYRTGLQFVADNLHEQWKTLQSQGRSRSMEIEDWIAQHRHGQPILVLDDRLSGESLAESILSKQGCVILCEPSKGFVAEKLAEAQKRLRTADLPDI